MAEPERSTHQKALRVNRDASKHGTFAEIGAGQEVARWFFHVGGAAGTVAKTMSAYDMAVSDSIYGPASHYVSRERLRAMLDHEYGLLLQRLGDKRGADTAFFVFADTMATRSYSRKSDGHGWVGVRFQHCPGVEPSEIILHVRMLDTENAREQEAIGILGVNLLYGAFYRRDRPEDLLGSLIDELTRERIEIDMVSFGGPCFPDVDNRLMSLQLVEQALADAAMFTAQGEAVQPSEVLHKRPVLVERGSFRPLTNVMLEMVERARAQFRDEPNGGEPPVVLMEMTLRSLVGDGGIDHSDFLIRADLLGAVGHSVMVSRFGHYHELVVSLRRHTRAPILFVMGLPAVRDLLNEDYYADLPGGILEAVGRLFCGDVQLCVYPWADPETRAQVTALTLEPPPNLRHLYRHLLDNGRIVPLAGVVAAESALLPEEVLDRMQTGDRSWESHVPRKVGEMIKRHGHFGYRKHPRPG